MCQELPALAVSLPQGRVAAEVSQHSRVLSLVAPPPSLSDLERKLGAAPKQMVRSLWKSPQAMGQYLGRIPRVLREG